MKVRAILAATLLACAFTAFAASPAGAIGPTCGDATGAVVEGTPGDDILYGTDGPDVIRGYGGNDTIYAGNGPDQVHGGEGVDTIYGEGCDDILEGDQDHDIVIGLGGTDDLRGDRGDDLLIGDNTDTFDSGPGNDDCWQTSTTAVYIVIYVYAGNPIAC